MTLQDFESATLRTIFNCIDGYYKQREQDYQQEWVRTRWLAYTSILPHIDTKKKKIAPQDLIVFDWEKQDTQEIDEETKAKVFAKWDKRKAKKKS